MENFIYVTQQGQLSITHQGTHFGTLYITLYGKLHETLYQGVESSTISSINFSILGSNKRFFDKLYDGSWSKSSIYNAKIT